MEPAANAYLCLGQEGHFLEERPGVTIRDDRSLENLGLQTYSLRDVEEHSSKRSQSCCTVHLQQHRNEPRLHSASRPGKCSPDDIGSTVVSTIGAIYDAFQIIEKELLFNVFGESGIGVDAE